MSKDYRMESKKKSLDAVDLNLLSISQKPNDGGVIPLGSKSNLDLRNNEYYEFEVKTNDTTEERNDQVIENVICHICDINVPKVYFNEHKNSFRHKFNLKIANIALRRLQLFMNKDDVNESDEKIPSKYYCSECSLVIDSDDEISHKQSIVHRNSIFLERFLNDFLNFYTNDENEINDSQEHIKIIEVANETKHREDSKKGVDSDASNTSETVIINDLKRNKNSKRDAERFVNDFLHFYSNDEHEINDSKEDQHKHCEDSKKGFNSDEPNISENVEESKISRRDLDSEEENNELDSSSILHKGVQVKDEVVFETVDGGRFKATELSFNALMKIFIVFEYCMICHELFATDDRSLHLNSDLHSENLLKKLPDKNCIRKVDNIQKQCILCNKYFSNYEIHIHNNEHITNVQNMIHPFKCKTTAPLNKKTENDINILPTYSLSINISGKLFCNFCNVWISEQSSIQHQYTMGHTLAYLKYQQQQKNEKN